MCIPSKGKLSGKNYERRGHDCIDAKTLTRNTFVSEEQIVFSVKTLLENNSLNSNISFEGTEKNS